MKSTFWYLCIAAFLCLFLATPILYGAQFTVTNNSQFQSALNSAASNGQDDTINVQAGTYSPSSTFTFSSAQNNSLTINGAGASTTILDGGNARRILSLNTTQPNANLVLNNLTFQNGTNSGNGGGVFMEVQAASITVSNCTFQNNSVTGGVSVGGGANVQSDSGRIEFSSCTFRGNTSSANVGGLFLGTVTGDMFLSYCTFEQNQVNNVGGNEYYGDAGGVQLYSDGISTATVRYCTFDNNSTTGGSNPDGAGLMTYQLGAGSKVTVEYNTFTNNQATLNGAGCFLRLNAGGDVICRNNSFSSNSTQIGDGAGAYLYIDHGTILYANNTHSNNTAASMGGGAAVEFSTGTAEITGNSFQGNQAGTNGGGLLLAGDTATFSISRNIFSANSASGSGGGVSYANSGAINFFNNTFYNNTSGDGGAMYLYFDTVPGSTTFTNSIFWQNQPDELNYSTGFGSFSFTVTYSDVATIPPGNSWYGTGCISADPLFANPSGGDLRLTWAHFPTNDSTKSPCIDTGDSSSPTDPDGTRVDMGALYFDQNPQNLPALNEWGFGVICILISLCVLRYRGISRQRL